MPGIPGITRSCSPRVSKTPRPCGGNTIRSNEIILSIDGLQPEKGHETLYVVRELTQKRVWFAEPLISATADEVRRLIKKAKAWAESLGKPVALWLSDRQDAFVTGIAAEFPDVPHRYCDNHFLRDVAKPVLEADSHAKVAMRKKVRGLRKIEQAVLKRQGVEGSGRHTPDDPVVMTPVDVGPMDTPTAVPDADSADGVVLAYCAAVRGILNDDQGGPLHPPGLRMAEALGEIRESIQRNVDEQKGGSPNSNSADWPGASTVDSKPFETHKRGSGRTSRRAISRNESRCNRPLLLGGLRLRRRWLDRHTRVQLRLDVRRLPLPVPTAVRRHLRLHSLHRLLPPARQRRST